MYLLLQRERRMSKSVTEFLGRFFLALVDLPTVDHHVVLVGDAINPNLGDIAGEEEHPLLALLRSRDGQLPGTGNYQELRAALAFFVARVAEKPGRQKLVTGGLNVFLSTDRFKASDPQYSNSISLNVAPKSDSTIELTGLAIKGLERIFHAGYKIRKVGVTLSSLELAEKASRRLWGDTQYEDHRRLMRMMDSINERFGRDAVRCCIYSSEGVWRTRFET